MIKTYAMYSDVYHFCDVPVTDFSVTALTLSMPLLCELSTIHDLNL